MESNKKQKTQVNIKELVESYNYLQKRAEINTEINSNTLSPIEWDRNTSEEIKAAKKAYNKLKKNSDLYSLSKKELITAIVEASKKPLKSNFVLIC